ncbi:TetR/AcrR family transcriptional regulator [Streptomyces nymphaeiformis]|uniref:AcrR family transcriptional regulator n=1 Tax=Streptomyces nymphaeiformis TaxID=2663842 RepID=A0A7W7TX67_9ACTN|nr:TetR/AcrR family transcriptional regulator [Streptomyces nymphaeiformis]MBB4980976.1 AcrR family transcriptional regulator [Streptomyces nymphaeiformis]
MSTPRGPYAKTSAKRQKILEAALAAYEEAGSRSVSVRDIAQRVGMTDAGVLHHFGNREGLLTAVLEARDAEAVASFGDPIENPPAALEILARNAATPGLVKLFVDVAAAAAEPEHPAHDFFARRYERYRDGLAGVLAKTAASNAPAAAVDQSELDADWAARVLLAVTDGLQLQWLLKPDIDMAADLARLHTVLVDALRDRTQDTS